jgi:hypothetical protein
MPPVVVGLYQLKDPPTPAVEITLPDAANTAFSQLALLFGVNLKSQLIDKLDGEFAFGLWGVNSTDATGVNAAFISQTSDPAAVDASLNAMLSFVEREVAPNVAKWEAQGRVDKVMFRNAMKFYRRVTPR